MICKQLIELSGPWRQLRSCYDFYLSLCLFFFYGIFFIYFWLIYEWVSNFYHFCWLSWFLLSYFMPVVSFSFILKFSSSFLPNWTLGYGCFPFLGLKCSGQTLVTIGSKGTNLDESSLELYAKVLPYF